VVQEEPGHQGGGIASSIIYCAIYAQACVGYALRPSSAAPAAVSGSASGTQKAVIEAAFRDDINTKPNPGASHHEHH